MRPSSRLKRERDNGISANDEILLTDEMKFKDGISCPQGTVPIRRMNQDATSFTQTNLLRRQFYSKLGLNSKTSDRSRPELFFGIAQSKSDPTKRYYGLGATLSVYNPQVQPSQYSSGEIILKGASDAIIVGWTVNPNVYKDNQTRFFIYTVADDLHCFDSQCGFISVRADIPLDFVMSPVSILGGPIYVFNFFVYQDAKNGNWWLEVGANSTILGFWPQQIFKGLFNSASYVACGGEAYGPTNLPRPKMGTGYFPFSSLKKYNSFCKDIVVVDGGHKVVFVDDDDLERFSTDWHNYAVFYDHDRTITYGGPDTY